MTNNRRAAKKQQREIRSVQSAEETPTPGVSPAVEAQPDAPVAPPATVEQVDSLMAEVESFLSRRDELAQKIAAEIEATELKLAELKKTAASLFPESASGGPATLKAKKPKPKTTTKAEPASSSDSASPAE